MSLLVAAAAFALYLIAYNTYGRYLGKRLFGLSPTGRTPAHEFSDGVDYVPARKGIVFGHHFASIAGTGPIVGPALAIIWGWPRAHWRCGTGKAPERWSCGRFSGRSTSSSPPWR